MRYRSILSRPPSSSVLPPTPHSPLPIFDLTVAACFHFRLPVCLISIFEKEHWSSSVPFRINAPFLVRLLCALHLACFPWKRATELLKGEILFFFFSFLKDKHCFVLYCSPMYGIWIITYSIFIAIIIFLGGVYKLFHISILLKMADFCLSMKTFLPVL